MKNNSRKETKADGTKQGFPLGPVNFKMMAAGFVVIILGFVLMAGGASEDPVNNFNYEMFSFRRITLAPILVLAGFVFEIYAIMYRPKPKNDKE